MNADKITRRSLVRAALAASAMPLLAKAQERTLNSHQEPTDMRVRFSFAGRTMMATLRDSPSARDFYSMLPLDLIIQDSAATRRSPTFRENSPNRGPAPSATSSPTTSATTFRGETSPCSMPTTATRILSAWGGSMRDARLSTSPGNFRSASKSPPHQHQQTGNFHDQGQGHHYHRRLLGHRRGQRSAAGQQGCKDRAGSQAHRLAPAHRGRDRGSRRTGGLRETRRHQSGRQRRHRFPCQGQLWTARRYLSQCRADAELDAFRAQDR